MRRRPFPFGIPPRSGGAGEGEEGFTLLELLLVMGLIFVLAGIIAPRFSDFVPSLRVKTTTDRIFAWAQKARSDAAITGLRQRLVFDPASKRFWIDYEGRPFQEPGKFQRLGGSWDAETVPDSVTIDTLDGLQPDPDIATLKTLEFRPDGTASADATIVISNDRGDRAAVKIIAATCRISIDTPQGQ